jgi:beta-glucosidase/6-phospho-beta-glucosidase/beta-galactosidase
MKTPIDSFNNTATIPALFRSFFIAGFESSTHLNGSRKRLDLTAATHHDKFVKNDYKQLRENGIRVAREGLRWHITEPRLGCYDFSSLIPIINAAKYFDIQILWNICHFGWPDHIDIMSPTFPQHIAQFSRAFAEFLIRKLHVVPYFAPINEISFLSYVGGDEGAINPFLRNQGNDLKKQLVRATISTMNAVWSVVPEARFLHIDPVINVVAHPSKPTDRYEAEIQRLLQYEAWDMIAGHVCPELGGHQKYLDIIGVNYYIHNQWYHSVKNGERTHKFDPLDWKSDPNYRPFRVILAEVYDRYKRPMFVAETGAEDDARAPWLGYVGREVFETCKAGIPMHGICLYPIVNHPGWEDDRHCKNGLWDYPDKNGNRKVCDQKLLTELHRLQLIFDKR